MARHSHPVASADGTAGIRSVYTWSTTFDDLAARAGNSIGLGGTRGDLASSGGASATCTSLVLVVGSLGNGLGILLVLVHSPIEDVVVLETLAHKEIAENLAQVAVVGLVVEAQRAAVVEVDGELVAEAAAEELRVSAVAR